MKKVIVIIVSCLCIIGLFCLVGCGDTGITSNSDSILSIAIDQMRTKENYTITTTVESLATGISSEKIEKVTVSDDTITVVTTYKKPNEIGADEAFTTTTEQATYNKDEFKGVALNVEDLTCTVDGNVIEVELTSSAEVESVFGLKEVDAACLKIKMKNNAFEYLTYNYVTSNQNKVTVTVK